MHPSSVPEPASRQPANRALVPKDDGPVFKAPWEAKVFAIVSQLAADQAYSWAEWTDQLADEISAANNLETADSGSYYEQWVYACEKLLTIKGVLSSQAIDCKVEELVTAQTDDHSH